MTISAHELARMLGQPHPPTQEQTAVIEADLEPMLVVAGAGSGKTETMAARVVYLVANGLVRPDQVLGLTFTRKAAGQLAERIRTRLAMLARSDAVNPSIRELILGVEPVVSTYHAFGGRVISEYGPLVGVDGTARVLTPTAAWRLARSVVQRWDGDLDTDLSADQVTSRVLDVTSSLSDHLRSVHELADVLEAVLEQIRQAPPAARQRSDLHSTLTTPVRRLTDRLAILPLVQAFSDRKLKDGTIDFGDQMMLAARLADEHPRVGANLRDRFKVVLLDEYQDTGHAQRVLLRQLFGSGSVDRGHPVTAVGDPVQSIYSWRGASASNLPHFVTDFPRRNRQPARRLDLLTSFRNPVNVLTVANVISAPVREAPVEVATLSPRPGADLGYLRFGLFRTVQDEDAFVAGEIASAWAAAEAAGLPPPSTAVLLRRRADMAPVAELLRSHGLPVEVSGLGGLLAEPEIVDLVALLRILVDPSAGDAAVRVLTGARWNLGLADLAAVHRRAAELAVPGRRSPKETGVDSVRTAMAEADTGDDITSASLVDAIADPGDPQNYSELGFTRLTALEGELRRLRHRVDHPLTELIADIERTLGLDVEVLLASGPGRAHLDAFADEVAEFVAGSHTAGPLDLLDYLEVAVATEKGLAPGEAPQVLGAVQVLTVHAAKGLEWQLVAVPHLTQKVFPGGKGTTWLTDDEQLPPVLRGDVDDIPALRLDQGMDQKEVGLAIEAHRSAWSAAGLAEERRLLYVAVTRAEEGLIFSSHYFSETAKEPRGPSEFFLELAATAETITAASAWAGAPEAIEQNPLLTEPRVGQWPLPIAGDRLTRLAAGAAAVKQAAVKLPPVNSDLTPPTDEAEPAEDPHGWQADVAALLAEREASRTRKITVDLPDAISVSALVTLAEDPGELARRIRRPLPVRPAPHARRGTAFHAWLETYYTGDALVDFADLPGSDDTDIIPDGGLEVLQSRFQASAWAIRTPHDLEVPFSMRIGRLPVRGRMDAVFVDPDGGWTVVDWKTGRPPAADRAKALSVQLAAYRLAWSALTGSPLETVRAVFHYVSADTTVAPVDLLDEQGLIDLIDAAVTSSIEAPDLFELDEIPESRTAAGPAHGTIAG